MLTAIVFLLVGLAISPGDLVDAALPILVGIVAVLGGRSIVIYGLLGGASRLLPRPGHGVPMSRSTCCSGPACEARWPWPWRCHFPGDLPQRSLLQAITFGIVVFTLIVQGGTIRGWCTAGLE